MTDLERLISSLEERIPAPVEGVSHGGRGYSMSVTWEEILVLLDAVKAVKRSRSAEHWWGAVGPCGLGCPVCREERVQAASEAARAAWCSACLGAGKRFRSDMGNTMVTCAACLGTGLK